jgi:hypothetical protein
MTRDQLARRFADLVDDDELLRRAIAYLEARETGSLQIHVVRGQVEGLDDRGIYRRRGRNPVR